MISIVLAFIRGFIFETSFAAEIEAVLVTMLPLLPLVSSGVVWRWGRTYNDIFYWEKRLGFGVFMIR